MQRIKEQWLTFRVTEGKDPQAFSQLYDLYIQPIHRFVFFKVSSREEAEDLTSQVFLKVWEHMTKEGTARVRDFRAFIYQTARNLVIDYYRARGKEPEVLHLETAEEEGELEDTRQEFVLTQLYRSDRAYLADCLRQLKDDYREVIILRYLEQLGFGEIANIIGKTQGNVRVLIHRGLKELRKAYESRGPDSTTQK